MSEMTVTLLGTGSPIPDPNRAGPATLVAAGGTHLLIDCGRGVVMRLAGAGTPPTSIDAILLTHLHSDHITDLNDVLTTRWITGTDIAALPIFGPPGTAQVVDAVMAMLELDRGYRCTHHTDLRQGSGLVVDVTEVGPGDVFTVGTVDVSVQATDHRPVAPTVGYRIDHDGHHVAIAGDTVPCEGVDQLFANADIAVITVVRDDQVRSLAAIIGDLGSRFVDILDYHSTVEQAGQAAARADVGTLMLTHYVPAPPPGGEADWAAPAAEYFDGRIVAGPDLTAVSTAAP